MIGKDGVELSFKRKFAEKFNIHRTRIGFPNDGIDTFNNMAKNCIYMIDRVVQGQTGGGVDLKKDNRYIPNVGLNLASGKKVY